MLTNFLVKQINLTQNLNTNFRYFVKCYTLQLNPAYWKIKNSKFTLGSKPRKTQLPFEKQTVADGS